MTRIEKINLRLVNTIFYMKHLKIQKAKLCIHCGKPKMSHYYRNLKPDKRYSRPIPREVKKYCFPYGPDLSEFKNDITTRRSVS